MLCRHHAVDRLPDLGRFVRLRPVSSAPGRDAGTGKCPRRKGARYARRWPSPGDQPWQVVALVDNPPGSGRPSAGGRRAPPRVAGARRPEGDGRPHFMGLIRGEYRRTSRTGIGA